MSGTYHRVNSRCTKVVDDLDGDLNSKDYDKEGGHLAGRDVATV